MRDVMKSRRAGLLIFSLLCALSFRAQAQTGIYGMFSFSHISGEGVGYGVASPQHGSISPVGGTFGAYHDFIHAGPVHLGGDARFLIENSGGDKPYGSKASGGLLGLRLDTAGIPFPLQPYAQVEVGAIGANNGNSLTRSTGFAYQVQGGVGYTLLPRLDLRLEYGAGQIAGGTGPGRGIQQLGLGLVLRL